MGLLLPEARGGDCARLAPPLSLQGGALHLLGIDHLGRDVLSRIIFGSRVSLLASAIAVIGSAVPGVVLGISAGYFRGVADAVVMRLVELQLAFPVVLVALAIVAFLGPTPQNIVLVFALTSWPF